MENGNQAVYCEPCSKKFHNLKSFKEHQRSKKHKDNQKGAQTKPQMMKKSKRAAVVDGARDNTYCLFSNHKSNTLEEYSHA